ncbi:hypothetical protein [Serinicoccus sp. CNJ-927]|uniref:hypothetical protein n=1 Tax=Serinicoccus sp. CNJ-927 TaxID=1904970 RepID=UPI000A48FBD8|nr:hypothetical protein [Serinicoccus sp. CNJ-927]
MSRKKPEASSATSAVSVLIPSGDQPFAQGPTPASIHDVTEYFLVGSFVSWLIALGSLALASLS